MTVTDSFLAKVHIGEPPAKECWEWQGRKDKGGYGRLDARLAHRVAWELLEGPIPENLCVLHSCDNPSCVNPYHLFLGTQKDNVADMIAKGRGSNRIGESNPNAQITEFDALEIRRLSQAGLKNRQLAGLFRMSSGQISNIITKQAWSHLA